MALINIVGYTGIQAVGGGGVQAPMAPPVHSQQVDTASDGTSAVIPANVGLLKVTPDAKVYALWTKATGATAGATHDMLPADLPQFFAMPAHDGTWRLEFTAV